MQGARMTPENLLIGLSENASNPARVAELVRRMVASVDNLGDPRKGGFMQDGPSAADLTADAVGTHARPDRQGSGRNRGCPKRTPTR